MIEPSPDGRRNPVIVFLDRATIAPEIPVQRPPYPHEWREYDRTGHGEAAGLRDADVAIVNKVRLDRATIEAAPRLRLVLVAATGMDNVDLEACRDRGIPVRNVVGYGATSVAEHVLALILALRRNLIAYRQSVIAGRWQDSGQFCYHDFPVLELRGARLVLLGSGAIGKEVARLGAAFGMEVTFAGRKGEPARAGSVAFDDALATADVVSLHCPLVPETRHLLGRREFGLMQRRPLLINTARGALIDNQALVEALRAGRLSGAGLDVLATEPIAADDPIGQVLDRPDVILTPHVAWAGRGAQGRVAEVLADELRRFGERPAPSPSGPG